MNISKFKYQYYNSRNIKKEGNRYGFLIFFYFVNFAYNFIYN